MNYVHYSLQFLLSILQNTVLWLFNTELVNYENISISFGSALIYFFIVYLVISLLLNATYSNIGNIHKENVLNERNAINAARREYGRNVGIHNVKYKENIHLESHREL